MEKEFTCFRCSEANLVTVDCHELSIEEKVQLSAEVVAAEEAEKREAGVGVETVEQFTCPGCGALNFILWSLDQTSRDVPCISCFHDEWDEAGNKSEVGTKMTVEKGKGDRTFTRDEETFTEIA